MQQQTRRTVARIVVPSQVEPKVRPVQELCRPTVCAPQVLVVMEGQSETRGPCLMSQQYRPTSSGQLTGLQQR